MVEKCKALKDLENRLSNKDIATHYGAPGSTDNIDDVDCPLQLTRLCTADIMEALDKLQDLSLFSSCWDEIRSLTLIIGTLLNKEQTEGLKQNHLTDFFQVVNQIARYTKSLYGRFNIELKNNITYDNNLVIFIVLSPFLENSNSR